MPFCIQGPREQIGQSAVRIIHNTVRMSTGASPTIGNESDSRLSMKHFGILGNWFNWLIWWIQLWALSVMHIIYMVCGIFLKYLLYVIYDIDIKYIYILHLFFVFKILSLLNIYVCLYIGCFFIDWLFIMSCPQLSPTALPNRPVTRSGVNSHIMLWGWPPTVDYLAFSIRPISWPSTIGFHYRWNHSGNIPTSSGYCPSSSTRTLHQI